MGQTACRKTSFVQSLGKNKIFDARLKSINWVSKITLTKSREDEIRTCFDYTTIEFHYPHALDYFDMLLETFRRNSIDDVIEQNTNDNCNIFGGKKNLTSLLRWTKPRVWQLSQTILVIFLTVCRKFGYSCLYIFHIIYLTKSIWQMILSQTKIFNIFPSAINLANILKMLTNNYDREAVNYIPARDL